jgi:hypothetical protein
VGRQLGAIRVGETHTRAFTADPAADVMAAYICAISQDCLCARGCPLAIDSRGNLLIVCHLPTCLLVPGGGGARARARAQLTLHEEATPVIYPPISTKAAPVAHKY